jgi:hypothetical protein
MSLQTPLWNSIDGTILPNGTLTEQPFDTQGYSLYGLTTRSNSVNGSLTFLVSGSLSSNSADYNTVYNNVGAAVSVTAPSGMFAIGSDALAALRGYRYIHIRSTAQTNGLGITLHMKAE